MHRRRPTSTSGAIPLAPELPGKLWTCRCPRKVNDYNGEARRAFNSLVRTNEVKHAIVLLEDHEDIEYAGVELEKFYEDQDVYMQRLPIKDYCVPSEDDAVTLIEDLLNKLRAGEHIIMHCAGGNGRTGIVLYGLYRRIGIKYALKSLRKVNSKYVETAEQEKFVESLVF